MADYVSAHITLGGRVPAQIGDKLCQAIAQEGLALDWCESVFCPGTPDDMLEARREIDDALVLRLYDDQVAWGEFQELEKFLVRHRIAFDRFNEGKYDISPGLVQYRPSLGKFNFACDAQGRVLVPASPLWEVQGLLRGAHSALREGLVSQSRLTLTDALRQLRKHLPRQLPPLTMLEVESTA